MPRTSTKKPNLWSDPEWEAISAARANISAAEGVRQSALLTERWYGLTGGRRQIKVDVYEIIRTLNKKKIPFVLTGAYGIAGWTGRPRATHDVDILVKGGRNLTRAVNALKALYPQLETRQYFGVYAFFVEGDDNSVIDVTYPHREDLQETLANPVWIEQSGERYRVPSLEAALANKYGAMLTPSRNVAKRFVDVSDFGFMVQHSQDAGRESIDVTKLAALGEKVWPGGGGAEILRLAELVKAGRNINLDELIRAKP